MNTSMADAVTEQIAALRDEDWAIRGEAASLLGSFQDPRAVIPLVSLLRDQDRSVREAAIEALRAIGAPAVDAVGACLAEPDLSVQESASAILSTIADKRVLAPLITALGSSDWIVRMHAAKALSRIRNADAVEPLIPLLQDKVKAVREEAAAALAAIGDAAMPSLLNALHHEDWLVRLHAVEALGKTGSRQAVEPLLSVLFNDRDCAVREDTVRALGEIGDPRAVEYLFRVMQEPGLRTPTVEALGRIGDPCAVPGLIDVITGTRPPDAERTMAGCGEQWNEDLVAQGAAARALGMIGDERAIPSLIAALDQTVTRADAAAALATFGPKVIPLLLPLLTSPRDENIQFYVRETLAAAGWRPRRM
jgi:HEAT repeat protein